MSKETNQLPPHLRVKHDSRFRNSIIRKAKTNLSEVTEHYLCLLPEREPKGAYKESWKKYYSTDKHPQEWGIYNERQVGYKEAIETYPFFGYDK